jgi:hypothetical protein
MVNGGDRLARLSTPRFVILRAEHLEFRPALAEGADADSEAIA